MSEANPIACPPNNQRLTQAVSDLIWNVEHSHVAGWGDCSTDVRVDASFKELKAALAEAGGCQPYTSKPPGVSTSASATGSALPDYGHLMDYALDLHIIIGPNGMCRCGEDGITCSERLRCVSHEIGSALLGAHMAKSMGGTKFTPNDQAKTLR